MKKQKTPKEIQEQADRLVDRLRIRMKVLEDKHLKLIRLRKRVENFTLQLDDPHSVIPKEYNSVSEWIAHEGRVEPIVSLYIFKNRLKAQLQQPRNGKCHIVRCKSPEFYRKNKEAILNRVIRDE